MTAKTSISIIEKENRMRRLQVFGLLSFLVFTLAACSAGSKLTWQYSPDLSSSQQETTKKITALFEKKCAALKDYSSSVSSAQISYLVPAMGYRAEAYGWKGEVEITLIVREDAILPSKYKEAAGHTLRYYIGSGSSTGIVTQKTAGQAFYGMQINTDGDSSVGDAEYSIVSAL
jgi:hypothetical protein